MFFILANDLLQGKKAKQTSRAVHLEKTNCITSHVCLGTGSHSKPLKSKLNCASWFLTSAQPSSCVRDLNRFKKDLWSADRRLFCGQLIKPHRQHDVFHLQEAWKQTERINIVCTFCEALFWFFLYIKYCCTAIRTFAGRRCFFVPLKNLMMSVKSMLFSRMMSLYTSTSARAMKRTKWLDDAYLAAQMVSQTANTSS